MKKIFTVIICAMIFVMSITAYASEQTAEATIVYTCDDSFYIQIPDTIVVGEESYITASEVNISPNKTIYVDLVGEGEDHIQIHNDADSNETIDVYFQNSNGEDLRTNNMTLATFDGDSEGSTQSFSTYVQDTTGKKAGSYSGIAMFSIYCSEN